MDVKAFLVANKKFLRGQPFSDGDKFKKIYDELRQAAAPEHVVKRVSDFMSDQIKCSCGWKSKWYWDGFCYAWGEWRKHVAEVANQKGEENG